MDIIGNQGLFYEVYTIRHDWQKSEVLHYFKHHRLMIYSSLRMVSTASTSTLMRCR